MTKRYIKYVSQNVLGMLGMSLYILADTFFISKGVGADGITALNLVLPVYNLIFAIGAMIGVGSAIRFTVLRNRRDAQADGYFFHALAWAAVLGVIFILIGVVCPDGLIRLLGGDDEIVRVGKDYTRIFMLFAPFVRWNYICNAFVRNDGKPSVAMAATLFSSLFNIVFDYVLMFPLGLGMAGAALATAFSPVVGISICCIHLCSAKCGIRFKPVRLSVRRLFHACQVGVSAFVGEISSGVITVAFNMIILSLAGNVGVAAYGVVANTSLVAVALFNGVTQGSQPLVSEYHGRGMHGQVKKLMWMSVGTALGLAVLLVIGVFISADVITGIFNSENNAQLAEYAGKGLRLYFTGFLFAGINIVGTGFLSAVESVKWAFAASIMRGFVVILAFAFVLSALLEMTGIWLAFPVAELITLCVTAAGLYRAGGGRLETGIIKQE